MAGHSKSADPADRVGVYKQFADVPARYRLQQHAAAYADRDVWAEFMAVQREQYDSDRFEQVSANAAADWKDHMTERGRHHALATPDDVEAWCAELLDRLALRTAYNKYWIRIEQFYDWMLWHTDHPHLYHPPRMAAVEYSDGSAGNIWAKKISHNRRPSE